MTKNVAEVISNAAIRENQNKNKIVSGLKKNESISRGTVFEDASQNVFAPGRVYIYLVDIYDTPISLQDFRELKPNIRATRGAYTLQYIPAGSMKRNPKFPYLIGQDLVRLRITVSGPAHWAMLCERIPELAWLKRNTTISGDLFSIAKKHPGLTLRFGIDFVKYCKKIENRAKELGIDIDHKPLVMYQWGANDVPQVDGVLNPIKTKKDYLSVLEESEANIKAEEVLSTEDSTDCTVTCARTYNNSIEYTYNGPDPSTDCTASTATTTEQICSVSDQGRK